MMLDLHDAATSAQHKRDEQLIKEGRKHPVKSGFCTHGHCEGKKPKSYSGRPVQVCPHWQLCPCNCHELITQMYKLADMPREWADNPEYTREELTFFMPVFGVDYGTEKPPTPIMLGPPLPIEQTEIVMEAPVLQPPVVAESGRVERGELEREVLDVCTSFMVDPPEDKFCTPQYVSETLGIQFDRPAPSTGAIHSVFMRWEKYDFAIIGTKPVRFQMFTPDGANKGLDFMRAAYRKGHK